MQETAHLKNSKFKQYSLFIKSRLSFLVVVSALSGYLFAGGHFIHLDTLYLILGGFLVTAASNGSNQLIEQELDVLMKRTQNRPLPKKEMSNLEAKILIIMMLVIGLFFLNLLNISSAFLGLFSYILYVFLYTPLKRKSSWAVLIGAFPGAFPPMIGHIAFSNDFGFEAGILFFIQFIWQFPHFWAIAWVCFDDYKNGGFSLLPLKSGKSKANAYIVMLYSFFLIPFSLLPWFFGWTGLISFISVCSLSMVFFWLSYRLYYTTSDKEAKILMFASFIYLPIVQFIYVFDKV
ncbi:MAG: protoheme IX farnesyltransferase [Flavobacteriia bacterium]|nr:protoheme IX farnesyltransferase [Flavobacteriia bacterium]